MSVLMDQHLDWRERRARLMGKPAIKSLERTVPVEPSAGRLGANLPRQGQTTFRGVTRHAVEFELAMSLVEDATDVPRVLMMSSGYSAAVAARHQLWTILVDGGHSFTAVAGLFGMDVSSVRLGVQAFRAFQAEKAAA